MSKIRKPASPSAPAHAAPEPAPPIFLSVVVPELHSTGACPTCAGTGLVTETLHVLRGELGTTFWCGVGKSPIPYVALDPIDVRTSRRNGYGLDIKLTIEVRLGRSIAACQQALETLRHCHEWGYQPCKTCFSNINAAMEALSVRLEIRNAGESIREASRLRQLQRDRARGLVVDSDAQATESKAAKDYASDPRHLAAEARIDAKLAAEAGGARKRGKSKPAKPKAGKRGRLLDAPAED